MRYNDKWSIIGFASLISLLVSYAIYAEQTYLDELKNGNKIVVCELQDKGTTVIDPTKIVGIDMDSHTIIFTNGSASSCKVKNK